MNTNQFRHHLKYHVLLAYCRRNRVCSATVFLPLTLISILANFQPGDEKEGGAVDKKITFFPVVGQDARLWIVFFSSTLCW